MPSPRKGSPVTGAVALGTGAGFAATGDWTMNAASLSMLIVAMPAVTAELGSVTNADPFQVPTMLDASIFGELTSTVIALRNVPGYGTPFMETPTPTPATTMKPRVAGTAPRSGAVMTICTSAGKAPAGTWMVTSAPATAAGPTVPPAGVMVWVVTTALNPPGGSGVATGGGTD